jgi:hypothetical protein
MKHGAMPLDPAAAYFAIGRGSRGTPNFLGCEISGGVNSYRQGGGRPFEQTTVDVEGTTTVVLLFGAGGSLLLKLKQPLTMRGSAKRAMVVIRIRCLLANNSSREEIRNRILSFPGKPRLTEQILRPARAAGKDHGNSSLIPRHNIRSHAIPGGFQNRPRRICLALCHLPL